MRYIISLGIVFMLLAVGLVLALEKVVHGAELDRVSVEVESLYTLHDEFIPEYTSIKRPLDKAPKKEAWAYSITLHNNFTLYEGGLGKTLWLNRIRGMSTTKQFRYVGYKFMLIQQLTKGFGVFYNHHSEHGLDIKRGMYPLQDSFGVSFCLGGREC